MVAALCTTLRWAGGSDDKFGGGTTRLPLGSMMMPYCPRVVLNASS